MNRARAEGFTLVELLVALALVGLVVTGAYETLRTAMRGWNGAEARTEVLSRQRTAERFVRRQIEQSVAVVERRGQAQRVTFEGTASDVLLYADFPAHLGAGLHELRLAFEEHEGALRLVARHRPITLGGEDGSDSLGDVEPELTVLLDGLERGSFEYFGPSAGAGAGATARWSPDWRDADRLPRLVRIAWAREDGRPWPTVVAAPRSNGVRIRSRSILTDPGAEPETEQPVGSPPETEAPPQEAIK